jgi:hypothetical protein
MEIDLPSLSFSRSHSNAIRGENSQIYRTKKVTSEKKVNGKKEKQLLLCLERAVSIYNNTCEAI